MNSEFPFPLYYFGLLIITVFLSRFVFRRYIGFAKRYTLVKSINARAAHKGLVFTGGGVVYAAVIMVAAVVLDNLDLAELDQKCTSGEKPAALIIEIARKEVADRNTLFEIQKFCKEQKILLSQSRNIYCPEA